eukprot:TRINITY_DN2601_c1_g1_i3.p1 TRINITY_DN2601_c1_g1~~TRINITY_DN2601_c1_g1_i3.p1  ORF type:complete len:231 (+),score=57.85 TRINITY_DN2601_c1_g1_i3:270-962(+)
MYFQKNYFDETFVQAYRKLFDTSRDQIFEIKLLNASTSFYGNEDPPDDTHLVDDCSQLLKNSDLKGYFEIYSMMNDFVDDIAIEDIKELSPAGVMFMLEFRLRKSIDDDGNECISLVYTPMRFYHRYARSDIDGDIEFSKQWFTEICENESIQTLYFARVQNKKSHAASALRNDDMWILLDSLEGRPIGVRNEHLWNLDAYAGRFSVMLHEDSSRDTIVLGSVKLKDLYI